MLAEHRGLKRSHHSLQREIGRFLFDDYKAFLSVSDSLEELSYQVEDARTAIQQCEMAISAVKGQAERVAEIDKAWNAAVKAASSP